MNTEMMVVQSERIYNFQRSFTEGTNLMHKLCEHWGWTKLRPKDSHRL